MGEPQCPLGDSWAQPYLPYRSNSTHFVFWLSHHARQIKKSNDVAMFYSSKPKSKGKSRVRPWGRWEIV